ncbi:hypothetical protein [Algibacter sp. 2305UL17-15]|uniref:hypothetical protein n=1 Tax=Algibacter sp. 2305UL17-15 TaxID=3231268 RepID=UPI00345982A0
MNPFEQANSPILITVFIIGLLLWLFAGRMNYKKDKYEFENTTSGGAVEYKDYKHFTKSKNQGKLIGCLGSTGMVLMFISELILGPLWFTNK